ncbi:MAG: malto-oligosyltrehalose trehalohydrolase [Pedobacter sp.]|nr:MAG: malto-oligosyltrehalose trehalohydrolase [Pedobacter sp.]
MLAEVRDTQKIGVSFEGALARVLVWAPQAEKVRLHLHKQNKHLELNEIDGGYWGIATELLKSGDQYTFELTTEGEVIERPDPASRSQQTGVHGPSTAVDINEYQFNDHDWKGLALKNYIIYELHIGTFSEDGNFEGLIQHLDHLKELGITAIEIMPVASFPGNRNWGYDGVFPFAVQESYGGPLKLKELVDSCHQRGIAVILDVVYNHLGPEGNYFADFAPYFTNKYQTPWGSAINFDDAYCDGVRNFFIENVLMFFRDFHIDALRLDAVHAIKDFSAKHILAEIRAHVDKLNEQSGRLHHLIIECDLNDTKFINQPASGGYGMDAQWMDEFHHALRVAAGQEQSGYYADFNGVAHLAKSCRDAYVYDGIYSYERKKTFGNKALTNSGEQFIVFSQNHDQVGNRMLGERSGILYSLSMQKLLAGAVVVSPFLPLFFMGEEWGEVNPFLYFTSHSEPELIEAVRKGRSEEFKAFHLDGVAPDPQAEETYLSSKLNWILLAQKQHQQIFLFYKDLIALRKNNTVLNSLNRQNLNSKAYTAQNSLVLSRWNDDEKICAVLNFSKQTQEIILPDESNWYTILDSSSPQYGGSNEGSNLQTDNKQILSAAPESIIILAVKNV